MDREEYQSQCEKLVADKDIYKEIGTKTLPSYPKEEFRENSGPSKRQGT